LTGEPQCPLGESFAPVAKRNLRPNIDVHTGLSEMTSGLGVVSVPSSISSKSSISPNIDPGPVPSHPLSKNPSDHFEWTVTFHNEVTKRVNETYGTRKKTYQLINALKLK
jgi:hypothetical protein